MAKMRSLSVSRNPLERLQEMEAEMNLVPDPVTSVEGNPAKSISPDVPRTHARTNKRTNAPASVPEEVEKTALAQLLSTPLEAEMGKGPFQAATVRMPVEVWKRVGWVASFSGRTKQEVIGEALISYLEQLRKNSLS